MKNFSFSLYAFHLHHTLTELPGEVVPDADLLWENLVKVGENSLLFTNLKDLRSQLICYQNQVYEPSQEIGRKTEWLTNGGSLDLGTIPTSDGFKISGTLQPFLFNDTYAVDLTLSPEFPNQEIDIPQLPYFQPNSLLPLQIQASLGQTIWIYGEVEPSADCDILAEKFAIALVANTNLNPLLETKTELFGSLLFEYQALDPNQLDNHPQNCQILILINNQQANPQTQTVTLAEKSYDWLLKLLWSHHKIHYVYQLARQRYRDAREIYSDLEKKIQEFNQIISATSLQLPDLKKLMAEVPQKNLDYTRCLQDIQTHHTTIITNITNYRICLEKIQAIDHGNSPQSWQDFLQKDCQKWQQQIQTDINYLTPAQELFRQLIDTIRGIVETEQAESDRTTQELLRQKEETDKQLLRQKEEADKEREKSDKQRSDNLQSAIAILGFGLGAAQVGVSTAPYVIPQSQPPKKLEFFTSYQPHPFVYAVALSILFGLIGALAGWLFSYCWQKCVNRKN